MRQFGRASTIACMLLVGVVSGAGCASHSRQVTTTEVTEEPRASARLDDPQTVRIESRTTTTDVEHEHEHHNGVFGIVGDILALPFRAVGALLTAIF